MSMPDRGFINLPCARLRVSYMIKGTGFPLVLVHGVGARKEDWDNIVEKLSDSFRVVCFDLRGHGQSTQAPGPYSLEMFSSDLEELLDQLEIERCNLAGHSLGGMIAQRFAIDHHERLNNLVIISAAAGRTSKERDEVLARVDNVRRGGGAHFERSLSRWFTDAFRENHPEFIEKLYIQNKRNNPACYAAAYRVIAENDLGSEIVRIRNRTLVITGEEDIGSSPRMARFMAEQIQNSKLHILPGLRHSILLEAPNKIAELMLTFFKGDYRQNLNG